MTQRKKLGEFHRGALVCRTSYSMGGSVHRMYGRVIRVDIQNQLVIWRVLGETKSKVTTKYPPPAPEQPSGWKFYTVRKENLPEYLHEYL